MIVQIGPYPPPYGGISIYIKRMREFLNERKFKNCIWSIYGNSEEKTICRVKLKYILFKILKNNEIELLHYNIAGKKGKIFIYLINLLTPKNIKKVITLHGDSKDLFKHSNFIMKKVLNSFDAIICVKNGDEEFLVNKGIKSKIYSIPAYIKPTYRQEDMDRLPINVKEFIKNSNFLICANGAIRFHNKQDLYGLDIIIDSFNRVTHEFKDLKLIFCVLSKEFQNKAEKEYYEKLKIKIDDFKLNKKIMLYEVKDTEFYPILYKSKIFLRPTNTDGDSVSIREAIDLNIPCIASDVVNRPKEVILFKNRDVESLYLNLKNTILNYNDIKIIETDNISKNNAEKIVDIYKSLI